MSFAKKAAAMVLKQTIQMLFKVLKEKNGTSFMITALVGENNFTNCKIGISINNETPKITPFEIENLNFEELLK
jgi:hypothetical protein